MSCCPPHHWDLNQSSYGVCRKCKTGRQFGRAWEPQALSWHRSAKTAPRRRGRPPKAKVESVAPPQKVAVLEHRSRGRKMPGASGFFGVTACRQQWKVRISVNGTVYHLGLFADPIEAARAYNVALLEHGGDKARINQF